MNQLLEQKIGIFSVLVLKITKKIGKKYNKKNEFNIDFENIFCTPKFQ